MREIYLYGLCSSKSQDWSLWSAKIGWDTPDPDITLCFQYTILNWVPLLFLWISCSIYIPMLWTRGNVIYRRRGTFNIFKSTLIALLLLIHIINLCKTVEEVLSKLSPPPAMYLQPVLSAISATLLIYLNRLIFLKGLHTSGVLFFYWLLQFVANLMILYSRYRRVKMENRDVFRTVTATLEFVLVLASFLVNCITDREVFENLDFSAVSRVCDESRPLIKSSILKESKWRASIFSPESKASFLSKLTFLWPTGLMMKGYRRPLTFDDLYTLDKENTCRNIIHKIEKEWNKELEVVNNRKRRKAASTDQLKINDQKLKHEDFPNKDRDNRIKTSVTPSFTKALFHLIGPSFILVALMRLTFDLLPFLQPIILGKLILLIENPKEYTWHGYFFAICLFIIGVIGSVGAQNYMHLSFLTGLRARTAIIGIIYRKALKLFPNQKQTSNGEILNLISVDSQKMQNACVFSHYVWCNTVTLIFVIAYIWQHMGPSILVGFGFLVCLIPVNVTISIKIKELQFKQMKIKDRRIKLINEVLSGMKIVKLYAWEKTFQKKIQEIRNEECRILRTTCYFYALLSASWSCAISLMSFLTFLTYTLSSSSNTLTVYKAFTSISAFNILNRQLHFWPEGIMCVVQARISLTRISKFLLNDELDPGAVEECLPQESPLKIINGTFSWQKNGLPVLKDINIDIQQGSLVAVVGAVGSGKTSLASALIGEMFKLSGQVKCRGSVAYVPQQAWCLNASVKDNILFNKPMNAYRYNRVIEACALLEDLKSFPSGDETEIGERGINLSGGQKQRISLARAVYQDSSIYILDDPLSAVDSHVGKHIFDQIIGCNGLLSNKTRVLITHGLTYLPKVDKLFVVRDFKISESGTFEELLNNNGCFAELMKTYLDQDDEKIEDWYPEDKTLMKSIRQKIPGISPSPVLEKQSCIGSPDSEKSSKTQEEEKTEVVQNEKLVQEESVEISGVKWSVYLSYIRSVTFPVAIVSLVCFILYMSFFVGTNIFLCKWVETPKLNGTNRKSSLGYFLGVYGSLGACQVIFIMIQNLTLGHGIILASMFHHNKLLANILRAPSIFFETTTVGRILNRIGKDVDTIDMEIFVYLRHWLIALSLMLGSFVVITIVFPYFVLVLILFMLWYIMIQTVFIKSSRQIKRLESISRSPINSHFQESLSGLLSIRAYKVGNTFIDKSDALTDENNKATYSNLVSLRWVQFFSETIGNIIILLAAIIPVINRSTIGPGFTALIISLSLHISNSLNTLLRMSNELEMNMVSVERIQEYINVDQEAPWKIEETKPDADWPTRGEIEFVNYSVRYRPELDLVLKDLNFVVRAGEKLGIVGRTGAGKSTLTLGLFRMMEPAEGAIFIDGVDISKLGLHNLRSKIGIIPQDPVIFCGTLRMNLDPFDEYSDEQLWNVLETAHLKSFVVKSVEGLNFSISDCGENLSIGQRQLISLARVLLRRTKILILDEATSAIDLESDDLIQRSIRDQFRDCTVLTIAHRINTIMDYDRVLVLQHGIICELDTPQNLIRNMNSIFYSMAKDAGLV